MIDRNSYSLEGLAFDHTNRFFLATCSLSTILALARTSKKWNSEIQSFLSHGLSDKFSIANYELVRDMYLSLPQGLRESVNRNEINLMEAILIRLPPYLRHQVNKRDFKKAASLTKLLIHPYTLIDLADENTDLDILIHDFDGREMAQIWIKIVGESEYLALNPEIAKILLSDDGGIEQMQAFLTEGKNQDEKRLALKQDTSHVFTFILLTFAAQQAFATGAIKAATPLNEQNLLDFLVKVLNANLPSEKQISNYMPQDLEKIKILRILNRNTVYALERGLIKFNELMRALNTDGDEVYIAILLSDMGLNVLEKFGAYEAVCAAAPTTTKLLELMYHQKIKEGVTLNSSYYDFLYFSQFTSYRTKKCLDAGYFSLTDIVRNNLSFTFLYLITSESAIKCFANNTLTFAEACATLRNPQQLAAYLIENRDLGTYQWLPLSASLLTNGVEQLKNLIQSAGAYHFKNKSSLFKGQPARPFREMLAIVDQLASSEKPIARVFQELKSCAKKMNNLKLETQLAEYEKELKQLNQKQTLKERPGVKLTIKK